MEPAGRVRQLSDLSAVPTGESAQIRGLQGEHDVLSRLASLGFTPGARVRVLQNRGRGPLLVALRDTRVALGRGEAQNILVETVPDWKPGLAGGYDAG